MTEHTAIMLCGDVSHDDADTHAHTAYQAYSESLQRMLDGPDVAFGMPGAGTAGTASIDAGLESLKARGATKIICLPCMLVMPANVKTSLPDTINAFAANNPDIEIVLGRDLGIDPKLLRAAEARISDAMPEGVSPGETVLIIAGAGAADAEANAYIAKMARLLWEGMGFAWAEVCYSGDVFPSVGQSIAQAVKLPYPHILVLPYFLFEDKNVQAIYAAVDAIEPTVSKTRITRAAPLGVQTCITEILSERALQALEGGDANAMNCQLCTFREQVLGLEDGHDHHHHDHSHDHAHSHDHTHAHSHDHVHAHSHDHDDDGKSGR